MNIFLLGATGRTGLRILDQGLPRGHRFAAMVRSAQQLQASQCLRVIPGDPRDSAQLARAAEPADVVLSCLGQTSAEDAALLTDSAAAMLQALEGRPKVPFIVVSQALLFPTRNPLIALLRLFLRRHVRDSEGMEALLQRSRSPWVIVRPPRLKNTSIRQGYSIAVGERPRGAASMDRADLATYLLDEAERRDHLQKIVGITSARPGAAV